MRPRRRTPLALLSALSALLLAPASVASPQSGLVGWGHHIFNSHWNEEPFVHIAAGGRNTIAQRANGTFVEWGDNARGEGAIPTLPPGLAYVQISVNSQNGYATTGGHSAGLRNDGSIECWGDNSYGQCAVPGLPAGVTYTLVAAGATFTIAGRSDGSYLGWGDNYFGQCNVPSLPGGLSYVEISAASNHAVGRLSNGNANAWGNNSTGCCTVPAPPSGVTYVEVSAGPLFSLLRRSDGVVVAIGYNSYGQCNVPPLPPGMSYTSIAAGGAHSLACRSDGTVVAWGSNYGGECDVPPLPSGLAYVEVAAGLGHSVARRSDGTIVAWGWNDDSQCNVPRLPPGVSYASLSISKYDSGAEDRGFVAALRSDGGITAWGPHSSPAPALPPGLAYTQVSAGYLHAAALRSDGMIVAWGNNSNGECNVPTLPPGTHYVAVEASGNDYFTYCGFGGSGWASGRTFGLRSDGTPAQWGDFTWNGWLPALSGGLGYESIAAAGCQVLARKSDGSAFGSGPGGGLSWDVPAAPTGLSYVDLAAGGGVGLVTDCQGPIQIYEHHALALRSDGMVTAWGLNTYGECNVPALPSGLAYVEVAAGPGLSVARRSDGSVVAWGDSAFGKCDVPLLPPAERYIDVEAGPYCTAARYGPAPACGSISRTCAPARPNTAFAAGATIEASGCAGISANNLVLDVSGLPASTLGMFLYGSGQQQAVFGNGWNCVAGSVQRVLPPLSGSPSGTLSFPVDLTQYPFSGSSNPILPSSGWYFQYWYRDPLGTPATFNTSDALHVFFAP